MFRRRFGLLVMLAALFVGGLGMGTASVGYAVDPATGSGTSNNSGTPDIPNLPATEFIQVKNSPINFPFLSPSIEQRSILLNAFKFQAGLFAGLSGASGANSIAIRALGILGAIVGALLIFFFPKYQKANVIVPWLLVVTVTVMAPYNSKLLFYPANSDMKTISCGTEANIAKCGFTPQLVAIHLAATMQRILSDLFVQQDWVDLISEVGADASMSGAMGAAYFTLGDEWPVLVNQFNNSCSDAARTQAVMDTVQGKINETNLATTVPTFGDFWVNEVKTLYVDNKNIKDAPPIAVLYTTIPDSWKKDANTNARIDAYEKGIFELYKFSNRLAGKYPDNGGFVGASAGTVAAGYISIADAITAMKQQSGINNFFATFDADGRIAPGFFFSMDGTDLANGGTVPGNTSGVAAYNNETKSVARACYYQPDNSQIGDCFTADERANHNVEAQKADIRKLFEDKAPESSSGWKSFFGISSGKESTNAWEDFKKDVLPNIVNMPVGISEFRVNAAKIPESSLPISYYKLGNDAIGFTPSTKGGRNCTEMFRKIANIVMNGAESEKCKEQTASAKGGYSSLNNSACTTDQKLLLSKLKPYLVPDLSGIGPVQPKALPTNNKFTPDMINGYGSENGSMDMVGKDNSSQAAKEGAEFANKIAAIMSAELRNARINKASDDIAKYRLLGKLIGYASQHTIYDKKPELAGNKQAADKATEINPVLMGNGALRLFGLGAFELGKIGTGVVAFITGGVAQAFVMFLAVLVDMALMAIIIMTPILFVFGLIMPSAAAGVLTVAVLGTFLLKLVPATLIILNALGGLMYVFIMDGVDSSNASFMGNVLIIAMSGLYMNIVGMTFFMIFKIGSPEAILGRLQGLDKGAKEMAEAGRGMAIAALGIAGAATAAGVGSALGNEVLKNRMKNKLIDMVPGGRDMQAAISGGSPDGGPDGPVDPNQPNNLTTDDKNFIQNKVKDGTLTQKEADEWIASGSREYTLDNGDIAKLGADSKSLEINPNATSVTSGDGSGYDTTNAEKGLNVPESIVGGQPVSQTQKEEINQRLSPNALTNIEKGKNIIPGTASTLDDDQARNLKTAALGEERFYKDENGNVFGVKVIDKYGNIRGRDVASDEDMPSGATVMGRGAAGGTPTGGSPTGMPPALGGTDASGNPLSGSPIAGGPSGPVSPTPAPGGPTMSVFVQGGQLGSVGSVNNMTGGEGGVQSEQQNNQQAPTGNTTATAPTPRNAIDDQVNRERIQQLAAAQQFLQSEQEFPGNADVQAKKKAVQDQLDVMKQSPYISPEAYAKFNSLKGDYLQSLRVAGDKSAVGVTDFSQLGIKRNKNIENSAEQLQAMREQAKNRAQELEKTNPKLAAQYQKFFDDTVTVNPLSGGMGQRFQMLAAEGERLERVNRLTKDVINSPSFLKALGSGIYGSFAGSAGGITSIPILGRMVKESLNEYMEGPERARAWNTVGGFGKMWTMQGDAQRLGFFNKAMAPAAAGETYQQMWQQGTFQAQADLARQAAVEAVARQRSQYDVLQWQLGKMNSAPDSSGPQRTNTMNAEDLRGIGTQDAMGKIRTLYAESVDMRKGVFNIEIPEFDAKGNLITMARQDIVRDSSGNAVRNAKGELQFAAPTVRKNLETLGEIYAGLAQKDVSSKTGDLLVKHYGIYEKRFNRHAKGWNETRDLVNSEAAMNAFARMDVDTDYLDEGHVKMFEGKEKFFGVRGRYKAYKELMNRENQEIAEKMQAKMNNIPGMGVTAKFNITPTTVLTDANGKAFKPADMLKQVTDEIGKEKMILQTVFENSFKTGYRNIVTKSSRKELFQAAHKEAEAAANEIAGIFTSVTPGIMKGVGMNQTSINSFSKTLDRAFGEQGTDIANRIAEALSHQPDMISRALRSTSNGLVMPSDVYDYLKGQDEALSNAFDDIMDRYITQTEDGIRWSSRGKK